MPRTRFDPWSAVGAYTYVQGKMIPIVKML